ncbi:MAG: hypothetical protein EPN93_08510 [Spirochaetes bacterium]|nr:MAG: hypothetical protein EPN93_08510 [Spirochaetota bacterium]
MDNLSNHYYGVRPAKRPDGDYFWPGGHLVSIETSERRSFFGKIEQGTIVLSDLGRIVKSIWNSIPPQFGHAAVDACAVLPDRVQGIVFLNDFPGPHRRRGAVRKQDEPDPLVLESSLPAIVRWYKGRCTVAIHAAGHFSFEWQSRYHDHVIRDTAELERVRMHMRDCPFP